MANEKSTNKPLLIITERDYFPLLYKYKNNNPDKNIKYVDKEGIISMLGYSYAKNPLPFLLEQGIDYTFAKKYMNIIRVADNDKNEKLSSLFKSLNDNDYLSKDDLGLYEISLYDVYLLELDEDDEIINLLKRNNVTYNLFHLEDLDIKKNEDYSLTFDIANNTSNKPVLVFKNKFAQYLYIFSDIRRLINDNPKRMNDIQILIKDESDIYFIRLFSNMFHIPVFAAYAIPLISLPGIREKINEIYNQKAFVWNEKDANDENLLPLKEIVEHFHLDQLKPFFFAYANLLEMVSSISVDERINDRGVVIENRYIFNPDSLIYVTNFQYGDFYKVFDDKNVLSDEKIKEVGCTPSYNKTKLDRRKKLNYVRYNNIVFLSRVEQHGTDAIFDSQFIEDFKLNDKKLIRKATINEKGLYTKEAMLIANADNYDRQFVNKPLDEYRSHDHSFNGINDPVFTNKDKVWSVTDLERFASCPFKYYISHALPIRDKDDDYHSRALGTLIHKLFEQISRPEIAFEEAFENSKQEYIKMIEKQGYTKKEEAFLHAIKKWTSIIWKVAKEWYSVANIIDNPKDSEQPIKFYLEDAQGERYNFYGRIDKIIWTKNDATNKRYYSIIDFKTGAETFDPDLVFLGPSSQLPIYYYAIENSLYPNGYTGGGQFGGFYIQHNYVSGLKKLTDNKGAKSYMDMNTILKVLKFSGLAIEDISYAESFDNTGFTKDRKKISKNNAKYAAIAGIKDIDGEDNVSSYDEKKTGYIINYNFMDLIEDAKEGLIENIRHILANEFPISPALKDVKSNQQDVDSDQLVCSFCAYGDICYKNKSDQHYFKNELLEHFKEFIKEEEEVGGEA